MNILLGVVCTVLMILGLAELIRLTAFWRTRGLPGVFVMIVSPESGEDCECAVRAAEERLRWLDGGCPGRLICLNRTGDPSIDGVCRYLRLRFPGLTVCRPEELEAAVTDCWKEK